MKKYNISANLTRVVVKHLYDKDTSTVLFNGSIADWFRTIVEVRQGCRLSPLTILQHIKRRFEDHEGTVSIGGRTITNLRFADDIDG